MGEGGRWGVGGGGVRRECGRLDRGGEVERDRRRKNCLKRI